MKTYNTPQKTIHAIAVAVQVTIVVDPFFGRTGLVVGESSESTVSTRVWLVQHGLRNAISEFKDSELIKS